MKRDQLISTTEAARILGVNRTQVFRMVKSGLIPAKKIGRSFVIKMSTLGVMTGEISADNRQNIEKTVSRVFREYGETIKKLGEE